VPPLFDRRPAVSADNDLVVGLRARLFVIRGRRGNQFLPRVPAAMKACSGEVVRELEAHRLTTDLGRFVCCGLAAGMRHCEKSEAVMDHEAALAKANEIVGSVLAPAARQNDKEGRFSSDAVDALGRAGCCRTDLAGRARRVGSRTAQLRGRHSGARRSRRHRSRWST
jgi:hypothetical protein